MGIRHKKTRFGKEFLLAILLLERVYFGIIDKICRTKLNVARALKMEAKPRFLEFLLKMKGFT